jgi:hypothetical protein
MTDQEDYRVLPTTLAFQPLNWDVAGLSALHPQDITHPPRCKAIVEWPLDTTEQPLPNLGRGFVGERTDTSAKLGQAVSWHVPEERWVKLLRAPVPTFDSIKQVAGFH